jgi:hypothetical protein
VYTPVGLSLRNDGDIVLRECFDWLKFDLITRQKRRLQAEHNVMEVIFESSKCFWRSRCTLDVCIVHHSTFDVLEVIAFEPNIVMESPRIFVDCNNLGHMIDESNIEDRTKMLKELFLRRKEVPDEAKLVAQARHEAKAELIMNRLQVEEYSVEARTLQMIIVETACDMETGRPRIVCTRPPGLKSYLWMHAAKVT